MKKIAIALLSLVLSANLIFAQDAKVLKLEQTEGEFTIKELTISPGQYIFEVSNNGVDREIGLVVAPEGKTDQANHIQEAYLKQTVEEGKSATSNVVNLAAGTYVYFCPLNPTPQYKLIVKEE